MPFEALDQAARFGGGKGLVERGRFVGVEIVLDQDDFVGVRKVDVGEVRQRVGIVDAGAAVGDLDMAPALERREHHEQIGHAIALIFVIAARRATRLHRRRGAGFKDQLL